MNNFSLLFAAGILSVGVSARAANSCVDAFSGHRTAVSVEGPDIEPYRALLTQSAQSMLQFYEKDFAIPSKVSFSDYGQSPMYRDGYINARFPFYLQFSFGVLTKLPAESLAINLHELGHQVFETTRLEQGHVSAELNWAFGSKVDMLGRQLSLDRIDATKANSHYADQSSEQILEHFAQYSQLGAEYEELFADTLPVLFLNDPQAIYKNIHFAEVAEQGDSFDHDSQKSSELRRFDVEPSLAQVIAESKDDAHGVLAPTRAFVWREYKRSGLGGSAMAKLVYRAILNSMDSVTHGFTRSAESVGAVELNADFQKQLAKLLKEALGAK